jgi:hypothetical protein
VSDEDDEVDELVQNIERGPPDASDGRAVRRRQSLQRRQQRADADVLRKLMMSPQGRSWMWRKLDAMRAFTPNYIPGSSNPTDTIYYEGMRRIGIDLLAEVMFASTDLYLTMVREAKAEEEIAQAD